MDPHELRGLLGTNLQARLLPEVRDFGEIYPRALDKTVLKPPERSFERIDFRHPIGVIAFFDSLDADLRARIKAIAENEPVPNMESQKELAIGTQLCAFGLQCDLSNIDEDEPNSITCINPDDLWTQLKMDNDSTYELIEQILNLKEQYQDEYCVKVLESLREQVEKTFAAMRAHLESLNIHLQAFLGILDTVRTKYLTDLNSLVREVRSETKEDDLLICQLFSQKLLSWYEDGWRSVDEILLTILNDIQQFCAPVVNVLTYRLSVAHEERTKSKQHSDHFLKLEPDLLKRINQWTKFIERTLTLAQYVRIKPCNAPDLPALTALNHTMLLLDNVSGRSPARVQAFIAAKMLLSNFSVVVPVDELLRDVKAANSDSKAEIEACTKQFQTLYMRYREDLKKQHLLVSGRLRAYQIAEAESSRMADGPISQEQMARHSVILQRMTELKPKLEEEQLVLSKLTENFNRVAALAASCARKCPLMELDNLKKQEKDARDRITTLATDAAHALERLRSSSRSGQSAQVEKMKNECLNKLNKTCLERNKSVLGKLQGMPVMLQRQTALIKRTLDVISQWCALRGGQVTALRPRLLSLDIGASLRQFLESRANLLLALHLFMRVKLFEDWSSS